MAAQEAQRLLRDMMLADSTPEQMRVCFALRLIQERLLGVMLVPSDKSISDYRAELVRDRSALVKYLAQLRK